MIKQPHGISLLHSEPLTSKVMEREREEREREREREREDISRTKLIQTKIGCFTT